MFNKLDDEEYFNQLSKEYEKNKNNINRILIFFMIFSFGIISFVSGYIYKEMIIKKEIEKKEIKEIGFGNGFYEGDTLTTMCLNNILYLRIQSKTGNYLSIIPKIDPEKNTFIKCNIHK